MSEISWTVDDKDGYWKEVHTAKVGRFEIVIHKLTDDDYDWFVNNFDNDEKILWHSILEGTASSAKQARKESIEKMNQLAADFKAFRRETKS